ncbi:unnamed protein product [Lota lota]
MSKATVRKLHWRSKVQESFVPLGGASGELGVAIGGGADYGEFPFVTAAPGGGATVGDVILEIGATPVLGMTLGDVRGVLNTCPHPIRIKTVSPGSSLCKDLRLFLSKCFTPGSLDGQLQQIIRENLYIRAVPCTTRASREEEISGVDYNFVSIQEFFSLEESGALLESGKFKGNYYGTPRPVHIGPESPPITYLEHRNLLRNFRTRSKSLNNLEKAGEQGEEGEEKHTVGGALPVSQSWEGQGRRGLELNLSNPGEQYYTNQSKTSWTDPRTQDTSDCKYLPEFTDQVSQMQGSSVPVRLTKGPRGFGFNIVGGSRPREFLQVYSITPGGPASLSPADILVYISGSCVLGCSHKEVVEMLQAVAMGTSVDVVLRRGYPMLYNPDGCPKQSLETPSPGLVSHAPSQPSPGLVSHAPSQPSPGLVSHAPSQPSPGLVSHAPSQLTYTTAELCNGNGAGLAQTPPSYAAQPITNGVSGEATPPPTEPADPPQPAASGTTRRYYSTTRYLYLPVSHRSSLIGYSSSSLPAPSSSTLLLRQRSSDRDPSSSTLPSTTHALQPPCGFNGCPASHPSPTAPRPGELVPVALGQSEGGPGFSVAGGGAGGQHAVVRQLWDPRLCPALQTGDVITKINGADVLHLNFTQVQRVLQEHTRRGEVVLLVSRGAPPCSPGVTPNLYKLLPSPLSSASSPADTPSSASGSFLGAVPPLSQAGTGPAEGPTLTPPTRQGQSPSDPAGSSLVQSTSFLDSVPVTLTLEPRDWLGVEESVRGGGATLGAAANDGGAGGHGGRAKSMQVELNRRPGEGFGFVIASQNTNNEGRSPVSSCVMSHRFVTVRRGSPAARSGVIQPGDRLEEVEGRAATSMSHRELTQILRRASNVLRLTVVPRSSSNSSEAAESDADTRWLRRGGGQRSKEEQWFYRVDLERGPTGFGFSLRGGSEYNMGLYVLALMEGGPAQRCGKIQISDQLVQINGGSTVGMTHGQAVEHIRRGGRWIHLVLKKGNGYVPDYAPERSTPPFRRRGGAERRSTPPLRRRGGAERRSTPPLRRRGEAERRSGVPDLDLDQVEEERGEQEQRSLGREGEEGGREGRAETERGRTEKKKGRQRERERKHVLPSNQKAAFYFLGPLDKSEFSQSATSITSGEVGSGRMEGSNCSRAELAWQHPGPWLEPLPHRLTQDLNDSRLRGRDLARGLSL